MADDIVFVDGLEFERPREGAPEFIKGRISIHADRLTAFIAAHKNENGYLNVDLKKSKKGELYLQLNTYKSVKQEVPKDIADSLPAF